jgi:hypothetical protein
MKKGIFILVAVIAMLHTSTGTANAASSVGWYNPANCVLRVDAPHVSSHVRGTINGTVSVTCSVPVSNLKIRARMWEKRWWGFNIVNERYVGATSATRSLVVQVPVSCRKNTMRVTGQASYTVPTGTWLSPSLSETRYVSC